MEHMEIAYLVIFSLLGMAVGSFLNVCVDRLPAGKSLLRPPSHCDGCNRQLTLLDLIPVFSYILLRGRCRTCGAKIPARVLWVEIGTGLLFGFLFWHYGLTWEFAISALYSALFIVVALIDLNTQLILNRVTYPAAVVLLILSFFLPEPGIKSVAIGGAVGLGLLLIPALIFPAGMGLGDVKLAAVIGLAVGFPLVFVALFLGTVFGGLTAAALLILKIKKRKEAMPFGPFLSAAAVITFIWGNSILAWYLDLL